MRVVNKIAFSLLAAVPVVALAACSGGGGMSGIRTSGPPPEVRSIVVDAVPTPDEAGLYVAQDNGYFKQQGLTVKIAPIQASEFGMGDLQAGKAQLVAGNYISFILAQIARKYKAPGARKQFPINVRIIADGSQMRPGSQALYVMPNSRIKTVADLTKYDAKVAANTGFSVSPVLIGLGVLLEDNGSALKKIRQISEPYPQMISGLASGKIDAAWLPEPFATIAQETVGAVPLVDFDQGPLQDLPVGAYVGTEQWVEDHPNTVAAFLRALEEGQQVADTDRAAVEAGLENKGNTAQFAVTPLQAAVMAFDTYPLTMDIPVMQRVSNTMFEFGLEKGLPKPYPIINMVQPEPGMVR